MLKLRPYQQESLDNTFAYWDEGKGMNPIVVLPTGAGKSLFIGAFCRTVCNDAPYVKILIITHSIELIDQNHSELRSYYEDASTGVYSASLGHRNTQAQIIFCGIQSVHNKAFSFDKIDIMIVDECHLISRKESTRYQKFITDLRIANPNMVLLGLTATPFRLDSGLLTEGEDRMFDGIAHVTPLKTLIDEGYLVPAVSKGGAQTIDLTDVHIKGGDYAPGELAHAADNPILIKLAVEEIVKYGQDRKAWLLYCSGIQHAEHVADEIRKHEVECVVLTGETPLDERARIIKRFKEGKLKCICNVMVLATGFNAPITDLIGLLVATKSASKYIQICGRGLRTYPGKEDCLILDYGNNIMTHGVLDEIDPIKKKNMFFMEKRAPPMKMCAKCNEIVHARTRICPNCGNEFPSPEINHGCVAYQGAVLASQQQSYMVDVVGDIWYAIHRKPGKPDSLEITYADANDREYKEYLCLEHGGFATEKGKSIVRQFGGKATTVKEAYAESQFWRKPTRIRIQPKGKWHHVTGYVFSDKVQSAQSSLGGETESEAPGWDQWRHMNNRLKNREADYQGDGND